MHSVIDKSLKINELVEFLCAEINKLLKKLLSQKEETSTVEFKREISLHSSKEKLEFAKDISAFANTTGGHILFGKEDKKNGGHILGIEPKKYNADQLQQIVAARCNPPLKFESRLVKKDTKYFVLVSIPESNLKPHEIFTTREVWVRRGGITDRATQREREKMRLERERQETKKARVSLKEQLEIEGIPERPENLFRQYLIRVGRWYTFRKYGQLNVALLREKIILGILGLSCFAPLLYLIYQITSTRVIPSSQILVVAILLVIPGSILFSILEAMIVLKCPECHSQFGVRRTKHIRVKDKELSRTVDQITREVTYRNTEKCEFCDYTKSEFDVVQETVSLA